jgi:hypothetical protein
LRLFDADLKTLETNRLDLVGLNIGDSAILATGSTVGNVETPEVFCRAER